jgi:putative transposase
MSTEQSFSAERALAQVPPEYRDLSSWPTIEISRLEHSERLRVARLIKGIELKLARQSNEDAARAAQVKVREFQRIFRRCLIRHKDGRIYGLRALPKGTRVRAPRRVSQQKVFDKPSAGYAGLFQKLFVDHPNLESDFAYAMTVERRTRPSMNKASARACHNVFLKICEKLGVKQDEYPFTTQHRGRRAFKKWMQTEFMSKHASAWVAAEEGEKASQVFDYQGGDGTAKPLAHCYATWQFDEVKVDALARYEVPNEKGDWEQLDLPRFSVVRLIETGAGTNLAWRRVLATQVTAADLMMVFWDAVNGPPKVPAAVPGLDYEEGAGYPANLFPQLKFALMISVELDNALSHLQGDFQRLLAGVCGAEVHLGAPKTPQARGEIEARFKLQAQRVLHQLPATTGSGPLDPVRKKADVPVAHRVRTDELDHVLDVYCANENITPSARAGYEAPLERLRRQLQAGAIRPTYLPVALRRPHFFNGIHPVKVVFDQKNHRRPFVNFLGARYTSPALQRAYDLKDRQLWARFDPRDLRTLLIFHDSGQEFGPISAMGQWAKFQHDLRIRKLFLQLKRKGELGPRPEDQPLDALFKHLREGAPRDRNKALQLSHLMNVLSTGALEGTASAQQLAQEQRQFEVDLEEFDALPIQSPDELPAGHEAQRPQVANDPVTVPSPSRRLPRRVSVG